MSFCGEVQNSDDGVSEQSWPRKSFILVIIHEASTNTTTIDFLCSNAGQIF